MGTHPIFESDFDCLTDVRRRMASVTITSIGLILCLFGLSLIVALLWPRGSRETTVPGPDKPSSPLKFLSRLAERGFSAFLRDLHGQYGGIAAFYFGERLVYSVQDEQIHEEVKSLPISILQSYRNFKCDPKSNQRQSFRQVKKWFQSGGQELIESSISSSCRDLNLIWRRATENKNAVQHVSALSMQIAAKCFCGIVDLEQLTKIRHAADNVLSSMNDSLLEGRQESVDDSVIALKSLLDKMNPVVDGCLVDSVPSVSLDFLLSGYATMNSILVALIKDGKGNPGPDDLSRLAAQMDLLPWICHVQDAGLPIQIGNHNIPNDALVLSRLEPSASTNREAWLHFPLGLFALCSRDSALWGRDVLSTHALLTAGIALKSDPAPEFAGRFLKMPAEFTLHNNSSVQ